MIAIGALALRVAPLLSDGGPLSVPTGYDDAVYYSASSLMTRGVVPYRDFVFVHPPGVAYFFALVSWLANPATGFAVARVLAAIVGGINTMLAGAIAKRAAGTVAGLVAAILYATYPDAVIAERSPYLEPILNLACMSFAWFWLRPEPQTARAAITSAFACATKVLGGIWVVAAVIASPRRSLKLIVMSAGIGILLLAPALFDLRGFITQTLFFHAWRPPDGLARAERWSQLLDGGHLAATVLAVIAIVAIAIRPMRTTRDERFFAFATVMTFVAFLMASSYWNHYNSHLAASQCVLAGIGAAALFRFPRPVAIAALAVVLALHVPSVRAQLANASARTPETIAVAHAIRTQIPKADCVFAFDPIWTLAAGRLPPHGDGAPVIVDSYGAMLLDALKDRQRFENTAEAFQSPIEQRDLLRRLQSCRFAIVDWRGRWQMNPQSRDWTAARFVTATSLAGEPWIARRLDRPFTALAHSEAPVHFGEGWFAEEGTAPNSWRWMGSRSTTTLPPHGRRLGLVLEGPPGGAITITLEGQVLDRFVAENSHVERWYDVQSSPAPRTLLIAIDRTFRPPNDARDLGISVRRVIWQ